MPTTDPTPTNPTAALAATPVPSNVSPQDFRADFNTYALACQNKAQAVTAFLEMLVAGMGNGAISGGLITAGIGLSASVAALTAFVGTYVNITTSTTVGSLTDNALNYLYLYQDGTFTSNTTGITPASSGGHGQAFQWGTVTTSGGAVTAASNARDVWRFQGPIAQQRDTVLAGETLVIGDSMQTILYDSLTNYGSLVNYGKLRVI